MFTSRYRKISLIAAMLMLAVFSFGQAQPNTIFGVPYSTIQSFDTAYVASLDPARRALFSLSGSARYTQAQALAKQGYVIDAEIMATGADPCFTMLQRQIDGLTWTPNALQPSISYQIPGQAAMPPYVPYNPSAPPPNAIITDTNPADYPPYDPPAPVAPLSVSPIGGFLGMTADMLSGAPPILPGNPVLSNVKVYSNASLMNYPEGYQFPVASSVYVFHLLGNSLMAPTQRIGVWLLLP